MKENKLDVYYHEQLVGSLAETANHHVAFAYENAMDHPSWVSFYVCNI